MLIRCVNLCQQTTPTNATPLIDCSGELVETVEYSSANAVVMENANNRQSTMQPAMAIQGNHQMMAEEPVEISQADMRMILMNFTLLKER